MHQTFGISWIVPNGFKFIGILGNETVAAIESPRSFHPQEWRESFWFGKTDVKVVIWEDIVVPLSPKCAKKSIIYYSYAQPTPMDFVCLRTSCSIKRTLNLS